MAQIQQLIAQDKDEVQTITEQLKAPPKNGKPAEYDEGDLEVAKAQLGLDTDELADAQQDLDRASGDQTSQIQAELNAHEATMRDYDKQVHDGRSNGGDLSAPLLEPWRDAWVRGSGSEAAIALLQQALNQTAPTSQT